MMPRLAENTLLVLTILLPCAAQPVAPSATPSALPANVATAERWWPDTVEAALSGAGTNRQELLAALETSPPAHRAALQFLIENMPARDLTTLRAAFIRDNVALAIEALEKAPWVAQIPADIFLNDILPYASLSEPRDNWRARLREIALPLVAGSRSPGEAARRLNEKLFPLLKVRYSTQRRRTDAGPLETIESGMATCTGLSILLVDACRAVAVPARIAGTPLWVNRTGNHTWVEVWDGGWHFIGAAEPDPNGLDRGWFVGNASQAQKEVPEHSIYATSYRKTGLAFPMAWAPRTDYVSAINVTERYAPNAKPVDTTRQRLMIRVLDRPAGQRTAVPVKVRDLEDPATQFEGTSKDEQADRNDHLSFLVPKGRTYVVEAGSPDQRERLSYTAGTNAYDVLTVCLSGIPEAAVPPAFTRRPAAPRTPIETADEPALRAVCAAFFAATNDQTLFSFPERFDALVRDHEPAVRRIAWEAYAAAPLHAALRADYATNVARYEAHSSPYTVRTVGRRPADGWGLVIAMHGGGNAGKEVNDSQWRVMQHYYRDHPECGGYRYVALRAPNDTWNGFYDVHVYPLVANLIRQFVLFGDVDPDKVFLLGYSHGGYGAFAIGPKMPDRFAAIHASAAAPTDGETTPKTLRNTPFTYMIGERDTMYGRLDRCRAFADAIRSLRGERADIYPVFPQFIANHGHPGLPDRDRIAALCPAVRQPTPRELTWLQTDTVIRDFFWLHCPSPAKGQEIVATCRDNRVTVTTTPADLEATLLLDSRLVDLRQPVTVEVNGRAVPSKCQPNLRTLCQTLTRRGDPALAFAVEVPIGPMPP